MTTICPDCSIAMKNHHSGVIVCETFMMPPKPYKLWPADLKICPNCSKRIVELGQNPIIEHYEDGFRNKLEGSFKPDFYWHERAGLQSAMEKAVTDEHQVKLSITQAETTDSNLNNLARKLAQGLGLDIARQSEVESVIQKAIEETLDAAEREILPELGGANAYAHSERVRKAIRSLRTEMKTT